MILKIYGPNTFLALPACCMSAVSFNYPHNMAYRLNAITTPFPALAAVLSGMAAGVRRAGYTDCHVLGIAGDGGTADIGLQALSGALDRKEHVTYICYDNEAYMNTGIQESGLTPYGAITTTTTKGKNLQGGMCSKKDIFQIIAAHKAVYAATASIGYPVDFFNKLEKARFYSDRGTAFIHVLAPCPTGWGFSTERTISLGKLAVECGMWNLSEFEHGTFRVQGQKKDFNKIESYVRGQNRFKNITAAEIEDIKTAAKQQWEDMKLQTAR
jgi:pyruvate ferredoxin oxidoreductase beta subunit